VVCGDNALALRLTYELMHSFAAEVTVIVPAARANQAPQIADLRVDHDDRTLRPRVVVADRLDADVFRAAGLPEADALGLVSQDDVANVDAALIAREVHPRVRLVARMFNGILADGVARMLGECVALSASEIAAPAFVAACLGDGAPVTLRIGTDVLAAADRAGTRPQDVLCALADTTVQPEPAILPADPDQADLVLVRAHGATAAPVPRRRRRRRRIRLGRLLGRNPRIVLAAVLVVLAAGTAVLTSVRTGDARYGPWRALYVTVLSAFGGAGPDLHLSGLEQVTEAVLAVAGVALIPALTAAVVEVVVNARLVAAAGGLTGPVSGHVVVVGLGNVGSRVIRELCDLNVEVVAIDRAPQARGIPLARQLGVPVIIGNANATETLRAASVRTCRALIVVSSDDVANLETALLARAVYAEPEGGPAQDGPDGGPAPDGGKLRVVLRLFDEEFAHRVKRAFDIDISRSVAYLAAPAFAAAMVGREVVDTIPIGRRVLLVAELPVGTGSALAARRCGEVAWARESRLIGLRPRADAPPVWAPPRDRLLAPGDRLLVVTTRDGLADLLDRTAAPAPAG